MYKLIEANIRPFKKNDYQVSVLVDCDGYGMKAYYSIMDNIKDLDLQLIIDNGSKLEYQHAKNLFTLIKEEDFLD